MRTAPVEVQTRLEGDVRARIPRDDRTGPIPEVLGLPVGEWVTWVGEDRLWLEPDTFETVRWIARRTTASDRYNAHLTPISDSSHDSPEPLFPKDRKSTRLNSSHVATS